MSLFIIHLFLLQMSVIFITFNKDKVKQICYLTNYLIYYLFPLYITSIL